MDLQLAAASCSSHFYHKRLMVRWGFDCASSLVMQEILHHSAATQEPRAIAKHTWVNITAPPPVQSPRRVWGGRGAAKYRGWFIVGRQTLMGWKMTEGGHGRIRGNWSIQSGEIGGEKRDCSINEGVAIIKAKVLRQRLAFVRLTSEKG